ncbi:gamma-glutamylcyclotransferase [Metamycoplasma neophronis]|uniref:Gamma-glutamylcyclotransferase n=1 Tax=Metamycoplasma neophronis TaxID=872983 RepID=A0ABY2YZ81_9BACT|nr:gamma-glutamylcyclotransferase [Metamycoplasma neophronis]TPR53260.1 gamma-glutamylcyclotransferase [Metamycoplasma neophronis]
MSEEKIYLFSYGTIQDELFYKNIFHEGTKKVSATLNGYAKCVDETMYFLLKKDMASQVSGSVFEITRDELFAVDRWEMFPQYQRFQVNVLLNETNEILENVWVYTKLEVGKYYLATPDMGFSKNPSENENNINAFIEIENRTKDFALADNILLYEINEEEFKAVNELTHPYFALIIDDKVNKLFSLESCALFAIEEGNKKYAALTSFGQKTNLNSIFYYRIFNDLIPESKPEITIKPLYKDLQNSFLHTRKPDYFLNHIEDKNLKVSEVGYYENKAFRLSTPNFNILPFRRFDETLKAFFDTKNK